jgi:hypothetical protein
LKTKENPSEAAANATWIAARKAALLLSAQKKIQRQAAPRCWFALISTKREAGLGLDSQKHRPREGGGRMPSAKKIRLKQKAKAPL